MPDPAPLAASSPDPSGSGGLSISELREIAARQQQQVENQQKTLRLRDERLRLLRSQEEQQRQFVRANPQLHQLREQVEKQELQLRRLRTLRGQMEQFQTNNENLASELNMIQTLCSEKERDLAVCIRKVNHLAAQMTDLNRMKQQQQQQTSSGGAAFPGLANNGGSNSDPLPPSQLDQIRRELQHRYPVPLGAKLSEQSHQLQARQSEAEHLDRRLGELRQRLRERGHPVPHNGEPVAAFQQRQGDAASSTGSSSNSSLFSAPLHPASASSPSSSASTPRPGAQQPRYASRSVIQDTYTRRLAGPNLERYKSKAHEIYRANLSQLNVDKLSSRTNTPRQLIQQHHKRHSTAERDEEDTPTPPPPPAPAPLPSMPAVTTVETSTETPSIGTADSGTEESSSSSQLDAGGPATPQVVGEGGEPVLRLVSPSKKSCLKRAESGRSPLSVTFEPLYLLLDGSLEGEMAVVRAAANQIDDVSACTEEGITALHTAICATQAEVVEFLIKVGADVNAMDADGWTPLHCAASCNNLDFVRMLVEHGAAIFLRTNSDMETALEKCEGEEDTGCAECLYNYQERLGSTNAGLVYAAFSYEAANEDELSFHANDELTVLRKGDATEKEWYWARDGQGRDGYVPRNFLALTPAVRRRVRSSPLRLTPRIASDHSDQTAL